MQEKKEDSRCLKKRDQSLEETWGREGRKSKDQEVAGVAQGERSRGAKGSEELPR